MTVFRARFAAAYLLVGVAAFASVFAFGAQVRSGLGRPHHRHHANTQSCVSPTCVQLGDRVSYTLDGVVSQVSSPQSGVVCVQVQSREHAGDICVAG